MTRDISLLKFFLMALATLFLLTHCGKPTKANVTSTSPTNVGLPTNLFPDPTPSPTPVAIVEPVAEARAPYFFNARLTREAEVPLLNSVGLGAFLMYPAQAADSRQLYECRAAGGNVPLLLTKDANRCATIGAAPSPAFWIKQVASSQAQHLLRTCYSPVRDIFYTKLGGNPCNAIPGVNPAFTQTWQDALEVELLGFASTADYTLQ